MGETDLRTEEYAGIRDKLRVMGKVLISNHVFTGLIYYMNYYIYYWNVPDGPYGLQDSNVAVDNNFGYWVWIDRDNTVTVP